MIKIIHDKKKCIGCGACITICPTMFEISENQIANLKNSKEINGVFELEIDNNIDCIKEAANVCPVEIIKIQE